jgi:ATP-binding cassette, subfamily B, bacterial
MGYIFMKNKTLATIKIYWSHILRHWPMFFTICFLGMAATAVDVIIPVYFKKIIDIITAGGAREIMFKAAVGILLFSAGLGVLRWALWRVSVLCDIRFAPRLIAELNNDSFAMMHKQSISFFTDNFSGSLVKKVNYFSRAFETVIDNVFWSLLPMLVNMAMIVVILFFRNAEMGIGTLIWLAVFLTLNFFFSTWKYKFDVMETEAMSKTTGFLADTITNFSNLKLFNGYQREIKKFAEHSEDVRRKSQYAWNMEELFNGTSSLLMVFLQFGLLWLAVKLWRDGIFTAGDFVLVESYVLMIINQSWQFGRMIRTFYRSFSDAEEMTEILLKTPDILDKPRAGDLKVDAGKIEFNNVVFCYNKTRKVLDNFNLTVKPGEKIALIGPSGAGKTTVVKLLLRSFDLTAGKIMIDGQDISGVTQESLWHSISLVPQDPVLFHRSLKENIRYGRPEASDEEVSAAARAAHCEEFISCLPEGYETFVGERGIKLSGGERQRVAIARAILRNSPILILDEATSSLDSESEHYIQEALDGLMKGKTVIVVAHRLSTIREMDRIIFIDSGEIKEEGTHKDLEKKESGFYRKLWEMQAGGFVK